MDATQSSKIILRLKQAALLALPGIVAAVVGLALCVAALLYAPNAASVAGCYFALSIDPTPLTAAAAQTNNRTRTLMCAVAPEKQTKPRALTVRG